MTGPLLTVEEAAKKLRCAPGTVKAEMRRKNLRATKVAGRWLTTDKDIEQYLKAGYNRAS